MSVKESWDVDKYREEHESEEHWELRKAFMLRWKDDYTEERLVCLARVFTNMEFMGCRYPTELMQEVSRLSQEVAKAYRNSRKNKLKRTFVSASTAAEDRAKGIKRPGGVIDNGPPSKSSKIQFVKSGEQVPKKESHDSSNEDEDTVKVESKDKTECKEQIKSEVQDHNEYLQEMLQVKCMDLRHFKESMFNTKYGRLILLIRPWAQRLWNIQTSCNVCKVSIKTLYEEGYFSILINGILVARGPGETKQEAKNVVEKLAWDKLKEEVISVLVKEQWIAQGDARISVGDVSTRKLDFCTPVENSVATKMMKLMGWKGGGLGADAQGIAEPIKANLQMVKREGLGSGVSDGRSLRRAAYDLMRRYIASDTLDLDLVFSSEFTKDERSVLHLCAQKSGLASRSYGENADRFLVIRKKLQPFNLAMAVIEKGGVTAKYQIFIPESRGAS